MAFAISSGMPPQAGIYCAIVTGFLISALGGSTVQIGGEEARCVAAQREDGSGKKRAAIVRR